MLAAASAVCRARPLDGAERFSRQGGTSRSRDAFSNDTEVVRLLAVDVGIALHAGEAKNSRWERSASKLTFILERN